jgi:hypothetical protein
LQLEEDREVQHKVVEVGPQVDVVISLTPAQFLVVEEKHKQEAKELMLVVGVVQEVLTVAVNQHLVLEDIPVQVVLQHILVRPQEVSAHMVAAVAERWDPATVRVAEVE